MRKKGKRISSTLGNNKGTQAIDRALNILNCFDFTHPEWGAKELSHALRLTPSTTQRMLKALESRRLLTLNGRTGKFELGLRVFEFGAVVASRITLASQAKEFLIRLRDETKETVLLVTVDRDEMLYISRMESSDAFGVLSPVGLRRPLATGSLGKAILSTYPQAMLEEYLSVHKLVQYTPRSIIDRTLYTEELKRTREQGFATDREELFHGICGVAAPITGEEGLAISGIAVAFPALRFDEGRMTEWGQLVRQAGLTISHRLSPMGEISYLSNRKN